MSARRMSRELKCTSTQFFFSKYQRQFTVYNPKISQENFTVTQEWKLIDPVGKL